MKIQNLIDENPLPENFDELSTEEVVIELWPVIRGILKFAKWFTNKNGDMWIDRIIKKIDALTPGL